MKKKYFLYTILIFLLIVAILEKWPEKLFSNFTDGRLLQYIAKNDEFLPGPLKGTLDDLTSNLTAPGVVEWTNKQRTQFGRSELRVNQKLNLAAESKLDDMFKNQYFEHESPSGVTPSDVVKSTQYAFLVVGENLALGNFKDDQALVEAWMNSPGHRENILHDKYQEIGVAVRKGSFEGKEVWLAVQEFGTPLSSCPSPSAGLKQEIERNNSELSNLQNQIDLKKKEAESKKRNTEEYNAVISEYNELVQKYNALSSENKDAVGQYNTEVNSFNFCLEKNG